MDRKGVLVEDHGPSGENAAARFFPIANALHCLRRADHCETLKGRPSRTKRTRVRQARGLAQDLGGVKRVEAQRPWVNDVRKEDPTGRSRSERAPPPDRLAEFRRAIAPFRRHQNIGPYRLHRGRRPGQGPPLRANWLDLRGLKSGETVTVPEVCGRLSTNAPSVSARWGTPTPPSRPRSGCPRTTMDDAARSPC